MRAIPYKLVRVNPRCRYVKLLIKTANHSSVKSFLINQYKPTKKRGIKADKQNIARLVATFLSEVHFNPRRITIMPAAIPAAMYVGLSKKLAAKSSPIATNHNLRPERR